MADPIPDFAHIRRFRDRQVLITRGTDDDAEKPVVTIQFDLSTGSRAALEFAFPDEEKRDGCWDKMITGEQDEHLSAVIDDQERQWGGAVAKVG
jgi:hypothetical protein